MAKLTAAKRNALPDSEFTGPGRSYPDDTKNRTKNALSRVSQFGSPALKQQVRAKVSKDYPDIGKQRKPEMRKRGVKGA
jgi:hypothetical protein